MHRDRPCCCHLEDSACSSFVAEDLVPTAAEDWESSSFEDRVTCSAVAGWVSSSFGDRVTCSVGSSESQVAARTERIVVGDTAGVGTAAEGIVGAERSPQGPCPDNAGRGHHSSLVVDGEVLPATHQSSSAPDTVMGGLRARPAIFQPGAGNRLFEE